MSLKLLYTVIGAAVGSLIVVGLTFAIYPAASQDNPAKVAHDDLLTYNSSNLSGEEEAIPLADYSFSPNYNSTGEDINDTGKLVPDESTGGSYSNSSVSVVNPDKRPQPPDYLLSASPPGNSTFVAAGDWGCNSSAKDTTQTATSLNPDLVLSLGDMSYRGDTACWEKLTKPIFNKTRIAIGNHDVIMPDMVSNYTRNFNLPNQYYSFDFNNVHVLVMSSEIAYDIGSEQYYFVSGDLAKAAENSSINWIIAIVHKPMYTSSTNQPAPPDLRSAYHPLFDEYGVDLVLMGHNHNYQRTYPLSFNSKTPAAPIITTTSKTCYYDPEGQVYLIAGTGGQSHSGMGNIKAFEVRQFDDKYGVAKIQITNIHNIENETGTIMSVAFYENGKLDKPIDPFQIAKGVAGSNVCQTTKS